VLFPLIIHWAVPHLSHRLQSPPGMSRWWTQRAQTLRPASQGTSPGRAPPRRGRRKRTLHLHDEQQQAETSGIKQIMNNMVQTMIHW
jgi:hypothetical protein